jgi:peptide/nickel transport system permease protein
MMGKYLLTRLLATIPLLLGVSVLVFFMIHLIPGSAAAMLLGDAASPENVAALEAELGLDDPLPIQYGRWIRGVLQGDLGTSLINKRPVQDALWQRLPVTLSLMAGGLFIGTTLGLIIGILAGLRPGSLTDRLTVFAASLGMAIPPFWMALMLIVWFAVERRWFPSIGYTPLLEDPFAWAHGLVLPWIALGVPSSALIARQTRSALISVLQSSYIRAARAAGVDGWHLVWKHALRNALIPVMTIIGFRVVVLIGSSFVVEQVFALPGMGTLIVQAVLERDIPVVQGVVLLVAVLILLTNLLIDLSYGWINPKVRMA